MLNRLRSGRGSRFARHPIDGSDIAVSAGTAPFPNGRAILPLCIRRYFLRRCPQIANACPRAIGIHYRMARDCCAFSIELTDSN